MPWWYGLWWLSFWRLSASESRFGRSTSALWPRLKRSLWLNERSTEKSPSSYATTYGWNMKGGKEGTRTGKGATVTVCGDETNKGTHYSAVSDSAQPFSSPILILCNSRHCSSDWLLSFALSFPLIPPHSLEKGHHQFSEFWHFHGIRDTEKINLTHVSKNFQELILKFSRFKILSGFLIYMWCQGFWQYLTPFLESLEFFKTYAILFFDWKVHICCLNVGSKVQFFDVLGKMKKIGF